MEPNDTVTRRRLAAALTDLGTRVKLLGSPARAIVHYREASAVDEAYAPTMYNLGVVLSELGRHDDALECYGKATELDSAHADAHCNIGVLLKARGTWPGRSRRTRRAFGPTRTISSVAESVDRAAGPRDGDKERGGRRRRDSNLRTRADV